MSNCRASHAFLLIFAILARTLCGSSASAMELAEAKASDPIALGWMIGTPPSPEKTIRFRDGSYYTFPQWRWTFSHWSEMVPTVRVSRGAQPTHVLPHAERADIDTVRFVPLGGTSPVS
jgi:hypothetical protein